jgi:5-methyltetrahydropteroyltriglutamate--homocysteine methyltransferase
MIPTEPIGSIPRPKNLIDGQAAFAEGTISPEELRALQDEALAETIQRFEETGSPVISDGEQTKSSFVTYPLDGVTNLAADGVVIPFADGHTRQLPTLASGPFRFGTYAASYLQEAKRRAHVPVKQAVIAASALSLLYPQDGIEGYSAEAFLDDLVGESEKDIRASLDAGAHTVQIDFTEGRLACKLDPSGGLLRDFVALNNRVLERFSDDERSRIGVHTCPGGDMDSTHSADVDYAQLLPDLFQLNVGNVYVEMAGEMDRGRVPGHHRGAPAARTADLRRRDRPDRPERGVAGRGARPGPRGRRTPAGGPARHDRRLRLRALRGRHVDLARRGVRKDPRSHRGGRAWPGSASGSRAGAPRGEPAA